jgi:serine/threonine protein kinase
MELDERRFDPPLDEIGRLNDALAGRYVVETEIGRGGMAIVYRARDLRHSRTVALKALHAGVSTSLGADRFVAEIRFAARLTHPHILPVHDSGEAAGTVYYVMPFVEGESLRHRMNRDGPLDVDVALGIVHEIADALAYAHQQGVIHRDIKLAWSWLRRQPRSALSAWYRRRFAAGGGRLRRIGIVALARKLLIALWRYLETGQVPEGAVLKA